MGSQSSTQDYIDRLIANWENISPGRDYRDMELATRLLRTVTLLMKDIMPVINDAGLNQGEFDVIATLYRNGGTLSPTALYQRLLITSGAMTNRLDTLESKGLVERTPDAQDKRSTVVKLTADGRMLFEPLLERYLAKLSSALSPVQEQEREAINQSLRQLLLHLEQSQ